MTEKTGHTLCFDGECAFCRSMMHRWRGTLERRGFELVPLLVFPALIYQTAAWSYRTFI